MVILSTVLQASANAHLSSETRTTVHSTKHTLDITTYVGTGDNAPDPCVPSLCYGQAYIRSILFYLTSHERYFDPSNFCNNQFSADYCFGAMKAAQLIDPKNGNETRILQEAWDLGWTDTDRGNYNGRQIFHPCSVDGTFCTIYLQGEVQGYADRIETNSGHPSITNAMSRICVGTEQFCQWYYVQMHLGIRI